MLHAGLDLSRKRLNYCLLAESGPAGDRGGQPDALHGHATWSRSSLMRRIGRRGERATWHPRTFSGLLLRAGGALFRCLPRATESQTLPAGARYRPGGGIDAVWVWVAGRGAPGALHAPLVPAAVARM
jgi:hypothetical protein